MTNWPAERSDLYSAVILVGLLLGGWLWYRRWRSRPESFSIFVGAICGAFLGAKILYLLAEGWTLLGSDDWLPALLSGKTIVGALLGGYAGVEFAKKLVGHREPTGDWFAVGVPLSIAMGRLGCLRYGCCPGKACEAEAWWTLSDGAGVERWPAVPLELLFNLGFVAAVLPIALRGMGGGQLFHAYLVSYGIFRFWHEFHRDTPRLFGEISGYQVGAVALVLLGGVRGWQRWKEGRETNAASTESLTTREEATE